MSKFSVLRHINAGHVRFVLCLFGLASLRGIASYELSRRQAQIPCSILNPGANSHHIHRSQKVIICQEVLGEESRIDTLYYENQNDQNITKTARPKKILF